MRNVIAAFAAVLALACPAFATVTGNPPPASYTCNGTTTNYTIPFPYIAQTDLVVTAGTTTLIRGTDYTVTPTTAPSTGTVKLVSGARCGSGVTLTIARSMALTQPQSFRTGAYRGADHEQAHDREEMQIQQNAATHATDKTAQTAKDAAQDLAISGVTGAVSTLNSSSQAVTSASSVLAFGSTTARTLTVRFSDVVNAKDYNAKGDNATDDAAALQAAWNAVVSRGNGKLYLPCGTYIINAGISVAPTFFGSTIEGESVNCVTIKAGAAMIAMWAFTDVSQNGRFTFKNITLNGNALAQYGIKSTKLAYSKWERVGVTATTVAAVQFQDGWDNTIRDSEFYLNTGDGLVTTGNANDVSILNVLFSNNTGWGLKTNGGGPFIIRGGAFQVNGKGGIYSLNGSRPLVVDGVYFEQNAQTGFTFTTPAKTVKADILMNGSGVETTMSHAFPSASVTVRGCSTAATYTEAFIYAISVLSAAVTNNYESSTAVPLVKTYGDNTYALPSYVTVEGNYGFSKDFDVESVTTAKMLAFSTFASNTVPQRNYLANKNVYSLARFGATGATIARGATKYNGRETFDVSSTSGDTFGITIDTTVTTELASALVYISAWAKSSSTTAGPRVAIGAKVNTGSFAADTLWHHIEFADFMPAAGTVGIGFGKIGATGGDVITFADVVIAVVGAPDRGFNRDILPPTWSNTAAPTTGTWAVGDRVFNSAPAVGSPKSWVCTVGGTPGTWVSEGNL